MAKCELIIFLQSILQLHYVYAFEPMHVSLRIMFVWVCILVNSCLFLMLCIIFVWLSGVFKCFFYYIRYNIERAMSDICLEGITNWFIWNGNEKYSSLNVTLLFTTGTFHGISLKWRFYWRKAERQWHHKEKMVVQMWVQCVLCCNEMWLEYEDCCFLA